MEIEHAENLSRRLAVKALDRACEPCLQSEKLYQ